jgi:hypothetical protein
MKPGERKRGEVYRFGAFGPTQAEPAVTPLDLATTIFELAELHAEMLRKTPGDGDVPTGDCSRDRVCAGFKTIRDDRVFGGVKLANAVNGNQ